MKANLELHNLVNSLKGLLPLANSHMVHFITHNSFERMLPKYLQEEIMSLDVDELNNIVLSSFSNERVLPSNQKTPNLISFLNQNQKLSLRQNSICLSFEELFEKLESKDLNESTQHIFKHLMSVKKSHEVEIMSAVVAAISKGENCTHIVDVGGGKGYLSSVLALKHQLKVLSVDSSLITSKGAEKQMPKVEKFWKILKKKSAFENTSSTTTNEKLENKEPKQYSELCKIAINFITEKTDVIEMIRNSFQDDEVGNVMLAGLHTCGNLAASSIRLFVENPDNIRCLVNVGCCYNLITEEFDTSPTWMEESTGPGGVGFPMSSYLRDQKFVLGRNARMLASQPPDRMCHEGMVETDSLFYRALLDLYLEKKLGASSEMSRFRVGRFKRKCSSFTEYVHKSIKRLGIDIEMSIFNILISYLSKEGREFKNNLSNLMRMFKDVRAPLLAGVLYTTKSIEDAIAVISNCMSNVRKQRRQGGGGHPFQRKNAISVYKIIENFLSEEGEQFKINLETLIRTYSENRAPLLAGILYTKRTIKEAMRVIAKTVSIMPKQKKNTQEK